MKCYIVVVCLLVWMPFVVGSRRIGGSGVGVGEYEVEDGFVGVGFNGNEVVENVGIAGKWTLVGHGRVTNERCGTFSAYYGCLRVELHGVLKFGKGGIESHKGKGFVHRGLHTCHGVHCPVCYKSGFAVREAKNVERRLLKAKERFGARSGASAVEHLVVSPPKSDYGLSFEALRGKVVKILVARRVVGGVLIFHGFRNEGRVNWYWSPHFHFLGFIRGGYQCRGCSKLCYESRCDGFEVRTRREFKKDGYIVKVAVDEEGNAGVRKTIFGSAWYQLNHAAVPVGSVRFHVATWFGTCSYRKLKVFREDVEKAHCPWCGHDLVKVRYFGCLRVDLMESVIEKRGFEVDLVEDGRVVWVEVPDKYGF